MSNNAQNYWDESMECALPHEMEALQSFRLSNKIKNIYDNVPYFD